MKYTFAVMVKLGETWRCWARRLEGEPVLRSAHQEYSYFVCLSLPVYIYNNVGSNSGDKSGPIRSGIYNNMSCFVQTSSYCVCVALAEYLSNLGDV